MPNIAQALKQEIARVARKELRAELRPLKTATARYRQQISALKKQIATLERQAMRGGLGGRRTKITEGEEVASGKQLRFSPTQLASKRKKLGLSARQFGQLIGVSALSVYKYEAGTTRPRAKQLAAIAAVRGLGKREAAARLSAES